MCYSELFESLFLLNFSTIFCFNQKVSPTTKVKRIYVQNDQTFGTFFFTNAVSIEPSFGADIPHTLVHGAIYVERGNILFSFLLNKVLLPPENITRKETKLVLCCTVATHLP